MDAVVDVGHGIRPDGKMDPGTVGRDGRREHDEAHEVVVECLEGLTRSGVSVSSDNHGSGGHHDPNWQGSVKRVNSIRPKVAVEVHWDANLGQNDGGFGLHYNYSSGRGPGKDLADSIAAAYRSRGLPVRGDGSITPQDIGRGPLGFIWNSDVPAVIWECGVIRDLPRAVNEQMGEAIAEGVCRHIGARYVPINDVSYDKAVVVAYNDSNPNAEGRGFDMALAHLLGRENLFYVATRSALESGHLTAQWVVGVGDDGPELTGYGLDGGVAFTGGSRWETLEIVRAAPTPDRSHAWRGWR